MVADSSSALTYTGRVFTWGDDYFGQLGVGSKDLFNKVSYPEEITNRFSLGKDEKIISLSISLTKSLALSSTGRVFSWGSNSCDFWDHDGRGRLGDGTTIDQPLPIEITSNFPLINGEIVKLISAGQSSSLALTSHDRIFSWGTNEYGEIGDGTNITRSFPTEITTNFSLIKNEKIIFLESKGLHSVALSSLGRVFMWGCNSEGQLGIGSIKTRKAKIPIDITSNFSLIDSDKIIFVSLGGANSSAISLQGRLFTWGRSESGSLGNGISATTDIRFPIEITSIFPLNENEKIINFSSFHWHTSVLTSTGRIFTLGYNCYGQLGNGKTLESLSPFNITSKFSLIDDEQIVSISNGNFHSSALTNTGRLFLWGLDRSWQLGIDGWRFEGEKFKRIPTESVFSPKPRINKSRKYNSKTELNVNKVTYSRSSEMEFISSSLETNFDKFKEFSFNNQYIAIYLLSGDIAERNKTSLNLMKIIGNDKEKLNAINSLPMNWGLNYFKLLYGVFKKEKALEEANKLVKIGFQLAIMIRNLNNFSTILKNNGEDFTNEKGVFWEITENRSWGSRILEVCKTPKEIVDYYKKYKNQNDGITFEITRRNY